MPKPHAPVGITILSGLMIGGGVLGILLFFVSGLLFALPFEQLAYSVLYLVLGYGLWKGVRLSWWFGVVVYSLTIALGLLSRNFIAIVIPVVILYYFARKNVTTYFGVDLKKIM
ncbi:MAG: hypothetical protein KGH61_02625 [Candidatus Micrarchaeota archaeon]|nr:hypothetical protein [Candidatus Micrarchaeota archaeon]MDE1847820.1 hypothetical protein [Candidatus Micrarchaeota archaeon]MDE1864374.1 hypothetical protein [Candidatus Micrarchaeota archaeon]